jgi:hypothetical protein
LFFLNAVALLFEYTAYSFNWTSSPCNSFITMSQVEKMRSNIVAMNALSGFSVIIVCCSNSYLSNYWQTRLEQGRGSIVAQDAIVLTVFEDWPGGAGNGTCWVRTVPTIV